MRLETKDGGWWDDEKGALGGKRLREQLWAAVKDVKAKRRSLKEHRGSKHRTEESIAAKEREVVLAEKHQQETQQRVTDYR